MDDDSDAPAQPVPESLLPYDAWMEEAMRGVMLRAIGHVAAGGLPGGHHFYITFRTDHPQTAIPARLRAQYPQEMTIVLQHQYSGLAVDEAAGTVSVGLSFGGVPSKLVIPVAAISAFADPEVQFGLRFGTAGAPAEPEADPEPDAPAGTEAPAPTEAKDEVPQVVSLDAFRRRRD